MQLSIGKLAIVVITLLIVVTLVTTGLGLSALHNDYRSLQARHEAEAIDTVRNAALSIGNQVRFYQGILQLISTKPEVANLLEFGASSEMQDWSASLRRLLPGILGSALASDQGRVHGDANAQRVGPACVLDMKHLHEGTPIDFPPLHTDVEGLEHFDLLAQVHTPDGQPSGTVFVSFHLGIIDDVLQSMLSPGDRFELRTRQGTTKLAVGDEGAAAAKRSYTYDVPDTSWELVLYRAAPASGGTIGRLVGADVLILVVSGILVIYLVRRTTSAFTRDMARVHAALNNVLAGDYRPSAEPTAIKETGILLPDIEQLALRLQEQRDELRQQSLSDPLTGVFNRRYFDMMLAHLHEQSRRHLTAYLVIIDVNDFKHVNDEHGHQTGDRVLQKTASFLRSRVRATDIVARLGGDEFALLLSQMSTDGLVDWVKSLLDDFDRSALAHAAGQDVRCRLSVGIAEVDAATYPTAANVFDAADRAMYAVKQRRDGHRSRFEFAAATHAAPLRRSQEGQ